MSDTPQVSAIAPWFGSNRSLAAKVGEQLAGCAWVGVPFAGGMCELSHIAARTIVVGDMHRHVISLARAVADDELRPLLVRRLTRKVFHPDELSYAQSLCREVEGGSFAPPLLDWAEAYFVCCWMARSGIAGTADEFTGRVSLRWNANGGDSNVRYRNAIRSMVAFSRTARRCTFDVIDAFDLLARVEDNEEHGIYCDPPFPDAGKRYRHNSGDTLKDQRAWHTRLRDAVGFNNTRVVMRYYDHPLIRELYPVGQGWMWLHLSGGKTQHGKDAPEVLIVKNTTETHHGDGDANELRAEGQDKARAPRHRKPRGVQ